MVTVPRWTPGCPKRIQCRNKETPGVWNPIPAREFLISLHPFVGDYMKKKTRRRRKWTLTKEKKPTKTFVCYLFITYGGWVMTPNINYFLNIITNIRRSRDVIWLSWNTNIKKKCWMSYISRRTGDLHVTVTLNMRQLCTISHWLETMVCTQFLTYGGEGGLFT